MSIQRAILVVAFSSMSPAVLAQQTGTVVGRTPGSAINARITSTMVVPKATCDSLVVTFGVVGCDYPGERARVYLVSLPDLSLTPVSAADRLSVKPEWTRDGKTVVYSDYTGSDSALLAYDLRTHNVTRLTSPKQFGPDEWLGWR